MMMGIIIVDPRNSSYCVDVFLIEDIAWAQSDKHIQKGIHAM